MERFDASLQRLVGGASVVGVIITYLSALPPLIGLSTALNGLVIMLVAVAIYLLWALKRDIEEEFENIDAVSTLDDTEGDDEPSREELTDGGYRRVRNLSVDKEEISTVPSISGALIGGVLGALTGNPAIVAAGAGLGAAIGGGAEYSELKDRHQKGLKAAAKAAVKQEAGVRNVDVVATGDIEWEGDEYWQVILEQQYFAGGDRQHEVLVKKSDGSVWYRSSPNFYAP